MSETTSRVLQLLGLLQSRRVWTGEELAERLAVTTRSVRRDVERLGAGAAAVAGGRRSRRDGDATVELFGLTRRPRSADDAGYVDRAGSDRDRQDWRSLRLDRMADVRAIGSTFTPRQAPDAAAYVRRSISASPYRYVARVRYQAPEHVVAQHFSPASVSIEADGPDACIVPVGADDPERMVFYPTLPGCEFEVLEPPEVVRAVGSLAERLRRAAG